VRFSDGLEYTRPQVSSTRLDFTYRGVLHEFLVVPEGAVRGGTLPGVRFATFRDGARSQNPKKYNDDAELLRAALQAGEDPELEPRYTFYLAQSCRDAGLVDEAIDAYRRRSELGGYLEEVYVSLSWVVRLLAGRDGCTPEVFDAALRAVDVVPQRAEASCHAATAARRAGRMPTAYVFARHAASLPKPETGLFIEPDVYLWRSLYELSIAAYYVGAIGEGRDATERLLGMEDLPSAERAAVEANRHFYA
jgi:tetratricopeptide (TPR) repeat protein